MIRQPWAAAWFRRCLCLLAFLVLQITPNFVPSCQGRPLVPDKNITTAFPVVPSPAKPWRMHTIFSVECQKYFDWQTVGLMHSLRKSGHPGPVTRLLSCTNHALQVYKGMDLAPTLVVPSMSVDPVTKDRYPAINKPAGVVHWLNHSPDAQNVDWVLILDADMIVRKPILPWEVGAEVGRPASASYGYLIGCDNELAKLHTKHPEYCDKVGGFIMMHIDDLRAMAPLWLSKTREVRADKAHWLTNITGDIYGHGWISEMYGYSFGAAEVGLRHKVNDTLMIYPGYIPLDGVEPQLMHYGLKFDVGSWHFSKQDYHDDNIVYECNRLFSPPPFPEEVKALEPDFRKLRGLFLSIECVNTLNEGLLLHHERSSCPEPKASAYVTFLKKSVAEAIVSSRKLSGKALVKSPGTSKREAGLPTDSDGSPDLRTQEVGQGLVTAGTQLRKEGLPNVDLLHRNKSHNSVPNHPKIHTLFSVECSSYFDWQTVGLMHSFRLSGQPGNITRLLSCTDIELKTYKGLDLAPTHVVPSMSIHPLTGDRYPAINKPAAVVHWLNHVKTDAEYIVILDADMILRGPITPWEYGAKRGYAVSAPYEYLIGCDNILAELHTKNPAGCQKVGGVIVMHVEDLKQFAPLWLHKTEEVRADRAHWNKSITGDIYEQGWISEMYGYVFGAAELGLKHIIREDIMLYPGYIPAPNVEPRVLHYGLEWTVGNWSFDKAEWHEKDMVNTCWEFFPEPPDVSTLDANRTDLYRRDALGIECVRTINEGLYFHHVKQGCREVADEEASEQGNNVDDVAYEEDVAAVEQGESATHVDEKSRNRNSSDDGHHVVVSGDDNGDSSVTRSHRSPPADAGDKVDLDDGSDDISFEEKSIFFNESKTVPLNISPRYWKVALWTLLVSCFLLVVSSVSRRQSSASKPQQRGQRSRQIKSKADLDPSIASGLPLSSQPSFESPAKELP